MNQRGMLARVLEPPNSVMSMANLQSATNPDNTVDQIQKAKEIDGELA